MERDMNTKIVAIDAMRDAALPAEAAELPLEGPSDLLYERMEALDITSYDVERIAGGMTAELEVSCACCQDKDACRKDLAQNPDDPKWREYCPNHNALSAFQRLKGRFSV